jgi:hypothetical protein
MVLFLKSLALKFENINFVLIFADSFEKFTVVFLSFDELIDKLISPLDCCVLFDLSESGLNLIELFHFALHFKFKHSF